MAKKINKEMFIKTLFENVNNSIDNDIKTYLASKKNRELMKEKYGKTAFLDSDRLKFPIINPFTDKPDCKLIYTAYVRASFWGQKGGSDEKSNNYYNNIKDLARNHFKKNKCENELNVTINEDNGNTINIIDFFDLSLLEYSLTDNEINNIELMSWIE